MLKIETYFSEDAFSNSYLLYDTETREAAVIDPSHLPSAFTTELSSLDLKYVLLTHGHFDHFMKAERYLRDSRAVLCVHAEDADFLFDGMKNCSGMFLPEPLTLTCPVNRLSDGDELSLGKEKLRVLHAPGHTAGSVCYLHGQTVFTGDLLFRRSMGRTDFYSGSAVQIRESLRRTASLSGERVLYPGHGPATTLNQERTDNAYLREVMNEQGENR